MYCFFIIDTIRCKNDKEPIFAIDATVYDDGGSKLYVGLFYNYFSLKQMCFDEETKETYYLEDKVITPWFFSIDHVTDKAFGK